MSTVPSPAPEGNDTRAEATRLRQRGFALCKPTPEGKAPNYKEWPCASLEPAGFCDGDQIGIVTGSLSDGNRPGHALVVIDLDTADAVGMADDYLPPTGMVEGRPGKPRSHRYYLVPVASIPKWAHSPAEKAAKAAKKKTGHPGPFKKQFRHRGTQAVVIDFIGTGGQCVCPPSSHYSGETRVWEGDEPDEPAVVPFPELWSAVGQLASACGAEVPTVACEPTGHRVTVATADANRALAYLAKVPGAVSGQGGHSQLFAAARALVWGFNVGVDDAVRTLAEQYNPRCVPMWSEHDLRHKCEDADRLLFGKARGYLLDAELPGKADATPRTDGRATMDVSPVNPVAPPAADWPAPMAPEAFYGLAGRYVAVVEPASEADCVALLVQFLLAVGNVIGRTAHAAVEADRHFTNEFAVMVGKSAKGRKGTSWGQVKGMLDRVDPLWVADRLVTGLSSGEGVIWGVRDAAEKQERMQPDGEAVRSEKVEADPGVRDKRLMVEESEFANVLKQIERQGNTLSPVVRQAWDGGTLRTLTKNSPAVATAAHISIIGHISADELKRCLNLTECANGFGNRFLWFLVKRSKMLPDGGQPDGPALAAVGEELGRVLAFAKGVGVVGRDDSASALWREVYPILSDDRYGLAGSLTGRAEAHVLRLSVIYAVLDRSPVVRHEHLAAALAVWDYADASVMCVFGSTTGNQMADKILAALRITPAGLTRTEIRDLVGKNAEAERIAQALDLLLGAKLVRREHRDTQGRPSERWATVRQGGGE